MGNVAYELVDGDGHILENREEIWSLLPESFKAASGQRVALFPPVDHFHGQPLIEVRGSERANPVGPKEWIEFLDTIGLAATVLYPSSGVMVGKIRNTDWAIDVCRAYNEWLTANYLDVDERFKGMALLPLQDIDAALEELRRAFHHDSMVGAVVPSHGLPLHLGSKQYWPLYAEAERLSCAIAIHGGMHDGFGFDDLNVYAGANALGHPFGQMISLTGLVLNGVFDRFPGCRFAFLEAGVGWFLTAVERLDQAYESHVQANPRGDVISLVNESLGEYLLRQVAEGRIFIGIGGDENMIPYAVDALGSNPFMYSTDFPHEVTTDSCLERITDLTQGALPDRDKAMILGENAKRLYGFVS